jgi:hypothetical protein
MGKIKESTKYNVISVRVSNDEKATIEEIQRDTRKSVTMLMREAISYYTSLLTESPTGKWRVIQSRNKGNRRIS